MKKPILQQSQNKNLEAVILQIFSETISYTGLKKIFLEVYSLTIFTLRFFREAIKPPYEFNELAANGSFAGAKF